jgi:hypothetical protein
MSEPLYALARTVPGSATAAAEAKVKTEELPGQASGEHLNLAYR